MVSDARKPLRYAITNLSEAVPGASREAQSARSRLWLENLHRWVAAGVEYVQLREKVLAAGEVFSLAQAGVTLLRESPKEPSHTRLLLNGRLDIAAAAGAAGVHLTSAAGELQPNQVQEVFRLAGRGRPVISVSCHEVDEVASARHRGADLVLFGPVFGKQVAGTPVLAGVGLDALKAACATAGPVPVLALGGVSPAEVTSCLEAGAAGIAGIRLFAAE